MEDILSEVPLGSILGLLLTQMTQRHTSTVKI